MNKDKKLSPKQKKIAAMAGDPNKIEGEDFKKLKVMKARTGEMTLADIVNESPDAFEAGDRASEKVLQEAADKGAERFKTVKGAKQALEKVKTRKRIKKLAEAAIPGASAFGKVVGSVMPYLGAKSPSADRMTAKDIEAAGMVSGGSVMARGCKMGRNKKTKIY